MESPNLKWMMTGGSPISGNLQIVHDGIFSSLVGFKWDSRGFHGAFLIKNYIGSIGD